MIALMTLWFGPPAGLLPEPGYFYLCPACYQACIAPLTGVIVHRLMEHHPIGRRHRGRSSAEPAEPEAPPEAPPENKEPYPQ